MRAAGGSLITFLAANNVAHRADLLKVTLVDGSTTYRWTGWDSDLTVGGNLYRSAGANGPLVKRGPFRQSGRLQVDTLDLTLNSQGFTIGGKSLGLLGAQGYFDGARVQLDHLIMPQPGDVSLGTLASFFEGRVSTVEPRGVDLVVRLKSELEALNVALPKFLLQPGCGNALYDANCTLSKAAFTLTGTVSGSTSTTITTASAALTAKAAGYFNLGVLAFTSGALNGVKRAIAGWSGTVFTLAGQPLASLPANGDGISVYPGCDKKSASCTTKFSNAAHYRGYPHIPKAEGGSA